MQFTRANSILVVMGCAIALLHCGCVAPWSGPALSNDVSKNAATTAATTPDPAPPIVPVVPGVPKADMTAVLDKLQQVQAMDPAAEHRLLDELRTAPPA